MVAWATDSDPGVSSCQSVAQTEVKFKMSQRLARNARNARRPRDTVNILRAVRRYFYKRKGCHDGRIGLKMDANRAKIGNRSKRRVSKIRTAVK